MISRLCLSLLIMAAMVVPVQAETVINKIVALVNGEIITQYDLSSAAAQEIAQNKLSRKRASDAERIAAIEEATLENLIVEKLFISEAEKLGINVKDSEIENELRTRMQQGGMSFEQVKEQMERDGLSMDILRERLKNNIIRNRLLGYMVGRKVVVTKEEIQAYYEEHIDDYSKERTIGLQVLMFPPTADASAVEKQIKEGNLSFEAAVAQYSVGPAKSSGGSMGEVSWADLADEWRDALSGLAQGDVTSIISINGHDALLKVEKQSSGTVRPLEEVADSIESKLRAPLLDERFREYSKQLREKAVIEIRK